ncbi:hypothetical protein BN903_7 [Halorubrum sp. AJ67]|nr:hypothetical protein BN903_7 [Halorubrum sp. AJ67]
MSSSAVRPDDTTVADLQAHYIPTLVILSIDGSAIGISKRARWPAMIE